MSVSAERDPFRDIARTANVIVARYQEALGALEATELPDELRASLERQLASILDREIRALCRDDGDSPMLAQLPLQLAEMVARPIDDEVTRVETEGSVR